jgi:archaellum component FlaC
MSLEELLQQMQASIDSNFAEVYRRMDGQDAQVADLKQGVAGVKHEIAELRHAVVLGTKSLSELMAGITSHQLGLDDQVEDLRRRVEALEKRLPPEAA